MGVHRADDHYYAPKNRRFACSPIAWYSRRRNSVASSRGYLAMRKFFRLMLRRSGSAVRACWMSSRLTPCGRNRLQDFQLLYVDELERLQARQDHRAQRGSRGYVASTAWPCRR